MGAVLVHNGNKNLAPPTAAFGHALKMIHDDRSHENHAALPTERRCGTPIFRVLPRTHDAVRAFLCRLLLSADRVSHECSVRYRMRNVRAAGDLSQLRINHIR